MAEALKPEHGLETLAILKSWAASAVCFSGGDGLRLSALPGHWRPRLDGLGQEIGARHNRERIPEKQTPGFWNNVSQCCGSAGVAEFFLSLYQVTHDGAYLEFAKRVTGQLLAKATRDREGMRWIQAEHRVRPEFLVTQTGYMQGAAGIGMLLLHLDGFLRGKKASIIFPDSPFD